MNSKLFNLGLDRPVLLNEHRRHLLSITEVGASSDTEVTTATGTRGVDPLQGSSLGADIVGSLQAVLSIDDISTAEGKRLGTEVVGWGDFNISAAIGPLDGSRLVVGGIVVGQVIDDTSTVGVINVEAGLHRLGVGLEVRAEGEVDALVADIDVGANAETGGVVGNVVDNVKAVVGYTDGELVGINSILVGDIRQTELQILKLRRNG